MGSRKAPEVARLAKCTRAAVLNYLKPGKRNIEALLLFDLADALDVSPRWLLTGERRKTGLAPDEIAVLAAYRGAEEDERELIRGLVQRFAKEARQ